MYLFFRVVWETLFQNSSKNVPLACFYREIIFPIKKIFVYIQEIKYSAIKDGIVDGYILTWKYLKNNYAAYVCINPVSAMIPTIPKKVI